MLSHLLSAIFFLHLFVHLFSSESSSGDPEFNLFPSHRSPHLHRPRGEEALSDAHPQHLRRHRPPRPAPLARSTPAALPDTWELSEGGQRAPDPLTFPHQPHTPQLSRVSGQHLVTVVSTLPPDWLMVKWRFCGPEELQSPGLWWILAPKAAQLKTSVLVCGEDRMVTRICRPRPERSGGAPLSEGGRHDVFQ